MDGLIVVDKPVGPTSHDVVARMRRILGESRIGHTGTLDPLASGVLPLVIGRATRLARFHSSATKTYEAVIRLGIATESGDAEGQVVGEPFRGTLPGRAVIADALGRFVGTFSQQPPRFSAKKIGGVRSHRLARRGIDDGVLPQAVDVTLHEAAILEAADDTVTVRVVCSAGFYVRALADDLGRALGVGAHLAALRRTAVGDIALDRAVSLADCEGSDGRERAVAALVPLSGLLTGMPAVQLTVVGASRAVHGQTLGPDDFSGGEPNRTGYTRLIDSAGDLLGVAEPAGRPALLHPAVVLV